MDGGKDTEEGGMISEKGTYHVADCKLVVIPSTQLRSGQKIILIKSIYSRIRNP